MPAIALAIQQTVGRRRKITRTELAHLLAALARGAGLVLADPAVARSADTLPVACAAWANLCTGGRCLLIDPPALAAMDAARLPAQPGTALLIVPDALPHDPARSRQAGRLLLLEDGEPLALPASAPLTPPRGE